MVYVDQDHLQYPVSSRATYLISGISHTKHEAKNWSNHPRLDSVTHKK